MEIELKDGKFVLLAFWTYVCYLRVDECSHVTLKAYYGDIQCYLISNRAMIN